MQVLLIKTSSLGDIIHTLPALQDAEAMVPGISFDWMVEEAFAEVPAWHPSVRHVVPVALRRWRSAPFSEEARLGWRSLRHWLSSHRYDLVLDAQGLVKSAFLAFLAKGKRAGLDWRSAREPLASLSYNRRCAVNFYQHAIVRMRELFSQALQYPLPGGPPDFGPLKKRFPRPQHSENYLVFLHGTSWKTKLWPEAYWQTLATFSQAAGLRAKMSGMGQEEIERANRLAQANTSVDVLPGLTITKMAALIANAKGVVAVDTGFCHLAAAMDVPLVSLYGPTDPNYTGTNMCSSSSMQLVADFSCAPCFGKTCRYQHFPRKPHQRFVSPCLETISPQQVWHALTDLLALN